MPTNIASIAKAGLAGACSIYLVVFGLFLLLPGAVMIGMSNNENFQDDFFEDSNSTQRIIGSVFIAIAFILLFCGMGLCIYVCKTVSSTSSSHAQPGVVLSTQTTQPLVSGSAAPRGGGFYPAQAAPQTYPVGPAAAPPQTYPAAGQPYPPQQPSYPQAGGAYPPGYPPATGYPQQAAGYAPPPGAYAPPPAPYAPPSGGGYPAGGYQAPPMESKPVMEPSAPPSYQDVTGPPPKM